MALPEATRVATPFSSGSKVGSESAQPSGRVRVCIRSKSATSADGFFAHRSNSSLHAACSALPRATAARVCSRTSAGTSKVCSGSKPRIFLVAATSSVPSAEPWLLPVFWRVGAGHAMIVRSTMKLGRSVTAWALRIAA